VSRLFVSLYVDEDVSVLVATLVSARGFQSLTTRDAKRLGGSDAEQLAFAAERQMAILTHNRADFEALAQQYERQTQAHCGIIIAVRRPPYEIGRRVLRLLNRITAEEMDNQVVYI
jgi:predicted nuclease of predicted toxin-antitoxin system